MNVSFDFFKQKKVWGGFGVGVVIIAGALIWDLDSRIRKDTQNAITMKAIQAINPDITDKGNPKFEFSSPDAVTADYRNNDRFFQPALLTNTNIAATSAQVTLKSISPKNNHQQNFSALVFVANDAYQNIHLKRIEKTSLTSRGSIDETVLLTPTLHSTLLPHGSFEKMWQHLGVLVSYFPSYLGTGAFLTSNIFVNQHYEAIITSASVILYGEQVSQTENTPSSFITLQAQPPK